MKTPSPRLHRHVPHLDGDHVVQFVTFRLADALPQTLLAVYRQQLDQPLTALNQAKRERMEAWLNAGSGTCLLGQASIAGMMQDTLLHFDGERYRLYAWCVMPNHVHVLLQARTPLARIVQSWKSHSNRWVHAHAREFLPAPDRRGSIWMRDYWDRYMRTEKHFAATVAYIHANPVKAGLCADAHDWRWSSARLQG